MKFLCIPCDQPMTLRNVTGPDRGSVSLVYSCPNCGYGIAMLTNPHETQVVTSLGVAISPAGGAATGASAGPSAGSSAGSPAGASAGTSRCPFSGMLAELGERSPAAEAGPPSEPDRPTWTGAALKRLEAVPELMRPMARAGIESFALEQGMREIDESVMDRARAHFGI